MPDCPHNSRDVRYKSKFGAVPAGESVRYRLMLPRGIHCVAAWFVVHRDDRVEWEYHPMEWMGCRAPIQNGGARNMQRRKKGCIGIILNMTLIGAARE